MSFTRAGSWRPMPVWTMDSILTSTEVYDSPAGDDKAIPGAAEIGTRQTPGPLAAIFACSVSRSRFGVI